MKTKVILADSMDLVLAGLQVILHRQTNVEISGTFQALTPLLDVLAGQRPDVILLDDRLEPALDVLALVERVQNAAPRARIIVMSNLQDGLIVQELLTCGVAGYLYKGDVISD
ncbi:MAG: response regulator transcription factor, partial [Anaerolineae bacterium]|nr:response regulator transcription factor [Anaerolineae bacterium]